jgi:hypothetical protein
VDDNQCREGDENERRELFQVFSHRGAAAIFRNLTEEISSVDLGLPVQAVRPGLDTYSDPDRFFNFRRATHRGEADYGRQVSLIAVPD